MAEGAAMGSDAVEAPKIGRTLTLLSAWFCPYAQRTWIALVEKGIDFHLHEVAIVDPATGLWRQLEQKPVWFTQLNPLGKVPVLAFKEESGRVRSVFESLICNEFLEDWAQPPEYPALFPLDAADKAHARMVIARFDTSFVPQFYSILLKQEQGAREACAQKMVQELLWLEQQAHADGPFFLGNQFSAVDCALLPWFIRLFVLKHFRGFELPKRCTRLVAWYNAAMARKSVLATLQCPGEDDEYERELLRHYSKYADRSANSTTAALFK